MVVMGTGPFAVPTFQWLLDSDHQVEVLVTRPIPDAGRRRKSAANPMRDLGEAHGIRIWDPKSVNAPEFVAQLASVDADLAVVCDYGQILSSECLKTTRLGGINLHASLLPKYRGAAPINWAIYHGESETGVTVIHVSPKLDAGPCLVQRSVTIEAGETAEALEPRLAQLGVEAVDEAIQLLHDWDGESVLGKVQDPALATRAPRLSRSLGEIDWRRSAIQISNQIRAFKPWPGTFTNLIPRQGKPVRLIIHQATPEHDFAGYAQCEMGEICHIDTGIEVKTGEGVLEITEVQPAGKRAMYVHEFLRGRDLRPGDRFGPDPASD